MHQAGMGPDYRTITGASRTKTGMDAPCRLTADDETPSEAPPRNQFSLGIASDTSCPKHGCNRYAALRFPRSRACSCEAEKEEMLLPRRESDLASRLSQNLPPIDHELHVPQNRGTHTDIAQRDPKVPRLHILEFQSIVVIDIRIGNKKRDLQGLHSLTTASSSNGCACYRSKGCGRGGYREDQVRHGRGQARVQQVIQASSMTSSAVIKRVVVGESGRGGVEMAQQPMG